MEPGQITPQTALGKAIISLLVQDMSIVNVLDVGCWNGMGTTYCVLSAMNTRKKPLSCISIEANKTLWEKAVKNYQFKVHPDNLRILHGRISETMMTRSEVESHPLFWKVQDHYKLWYDQDKKDFDSTPCLSVSIPMDMVILDGGEFCGKADLDAVLKMNPRYIFLDDTEVMKNCENAIALGKMGWEMIWHTKERNGSVLFHKKKT